MNVRYKNKFTLPQELGDGRLDTVIAIFDYLKKHSGQKKELILDWKKVQRITPAGCAILACLFDSIFEQNFQVKMINYSQNRNKINLSLILNNLLLYKRNFKAFPKPTIHNNISDTYILCGGETSINLSFIELVKTQYSHILSDDLLFSCSLITNELMQNCVDHSTSERYYLYAGPYNNEFHFGILDMGVTIPAKLEQKYPCKNDVEFLALALKKGTSTRRKTIGGFGLHYTFDILKQDNGRLTVISRQAQIRRYFKSKQVHRRLLKNPLNGTWCFTRLPIMK